MNRYLAAVVESIPYIVVIGVIGLGLYMNALIVQDTITLKEAETIGYILLTILITLEIISLILLKEKEIEKAELTQSVKISKEKIDDLEFELEKIKNK